MRPAAAARGCAGVRFSVQDASKCLEASATLQADLFEEFSLVPERLEFSINLHSMLECLQIFGVATLSTTSLYACFNDEEMTFDLHLTESDAVTHCALKVLEGEDHGADLMGAFQNQVACAKAIVTSSFLREAFHEVSDFPGANVVHLTLSPEEPRLALVVSGVSGSCRIESSPSTDAFTSFDARRRNQACFKHDLMQHAVRALPSARQTLLRFTEDGVLYMQHKIVDEVERALFVHVMLLPDETGEAVADAGGSPTPP